MATEQAIALITGANKGIGFEIGRQLGHKGIAVIIGARDERRGLAAESRLRTEGLNAHFQFLDVSNDLSVRNAAQMIQDKFGQLSILVNNAGVYLDEDVSIFDVTEETLCATLEVNLFGAFRMCRAFVQLMREGGHGRIVNVTSGLGSLTEMGGATAAYRISKTALNALTCILAAEVHEFGIKVNAGCPGWVRTEIGGAGAPRSVEEGADTLVWLATLPDDGPTGGLFRDRRPIPW